MLYFIGFIAKRNKKHTEQFVEATIKLLTCLLLPIVIFNAMASTQFNPQTALMPIALIFTFSLLTLMGFIIIKNRDYSLKTNGAVLTTFGTLEGGSVGSALVVSLLPGEAFLNFVVFDITHAFLLFSVVYLISRNYGSSINFEIAKKERKIASMVLSFLFSPLMIAFIAGFIFRLFPVSLEKFNIIFLTAGKLLLPAALLILGLRSSFSIKTVKKAVTLSIIKVGTGALAGKLFSMLFHLSSMVSAVVIIGSMLPPSLLTIIYSEEQGLDSELTGSFITICTLISIGIVFMTRFLKLI